MFIYLIVILVILILYQTFKNIPIYILSREICEYANKVPGPPGNFFGNLTQFYTTPEKLFPVRVEYAKKFYPICDIWLPRLHAICILNPEDFELILTNPKHNTKNILYGFLTNWLGFGLLISNDEKWFTRRRLLTPAFHFSILRQFTEVFYDKTHSLVEDIEKESVKSFVNIDPIIGDYTLKCITETSMGTKLNFETNQHKEFKKAVEGITKIYTYRIMRPWLTNNVVRFIKPIMAFKELKMLHTLHSFSANIIKKRQKNFVHFPESLEDEIGKKKKLAMLDLMLTVKEKEGIIDDNGIREEVDTFIFEGHDTTSTSLCYTLMLLACHKDIQGKVVEEMKEILIDIKTKPTMEQLQNLKYMEQCIKESLRLYPPVHAISRNLGEDVELHSGYKLLKGSLLILSIYDLHHSPHVWPDPEKFDPDRFLPDNYQQRHPFAFLPFSAGGRNCIGQRFAMLEMKTALCAILSNFILEPFDTPETVVLIIDIILRAKDKIRIKFIRR